MKVETKAHITTIKDTQNDLISFVDKVTHEYKSFEKTNLIIDISSYENLSIKEISTFLPLAKLHKKHKKSFVLVVSDFDYNKAPASLTVVPTKLEAHDIIEMEEIERDLGF